ncbi:ABC transporter ATP-binding protein [Desulfovibrio sp. UCD-KL4C]|uniref:ABC transporter ATP-binding protein n=1 Tax=Desulfovibrio sp. UCD-KL4C TaxID=2578120 RepID=UPI0025C3482A|nr:ABC transporter ATP-binding protein [Desulfovibrio sp. UCD-KL4C]
MINMLQKKFALSEQGAKDLVVGSLACLFHNISLMLPVGLLYYFICELVVDGSTNRAFFYMGCSVICLILIAITSFFQYNLTYLPPYNESCIRRISLAEQLRKLPLSFFARKDLSDLTSVIMSDCSFLERVFSHFIPQLVGSILSTVLIGISLFFIDWRMGIAAMWGVPIAFIIIAMSSKVQDRLQEKQMDAKMACADGIQECIETVRDLKACNAEEEYLKELDKKIDAVESRAVFSEFGTAVFVVSSGLLLKLGIATVALAGSLLLVEGQIDLLTFFMFLLVASRLYDPLQESLHNLMGIILARTNISRTKNILEHPKQSGVPQLTNKGYDVVLHDVGFSYNDSNYVLNDVSLTINQGDVTALVGPSGGGKTTVSRLVARFWEVNKGSITIGGMDISNIDPERLFSLFAIVFQDVTLFNDTIMENIRVGKHDATDEEVLAAAKHAYCDKIASKLPDGWNTMIGENGCTLSGGERQRISIARAFLKNAPILLLDEATASLDVENETLIQTALSRLIKDKTVLVIAHRMRTVAGADKIVVLAEGSVVEEGSPAELIEKDSVYRHMVELQTQGQEWSI